MHPEGVDTEKCLDFRLNPEVKEDEQWSPQGYSFYGGELVKNSSRYAQAEQLEILDNHPYFTGFCPNCKYQFDPDNPPLVHWDCPSCGWMIQFRLSEELNEVEAIEAISPNSVTSKLWNSVFQEEVIEKSACC